MRLARRAVELRRQRGLVALAGKAARVSGEYVRSARAALEVRRRVRQPFASAEALDFAYSFERGGVRFPPIQHRSEIADLLELGRADPPSRVLEIGIGFGGSLFLLAQVAAAQARIAAVDLPPGPGRYHPSRELVFRAFARPGQTIRVFPTNSHDPATVAAVRDFLGDQVDLLLIDGDHSFEGVSRDYELYRPFVRRGGLVVIHDIVPAIAGVATFWRTLKDTTPGSAIEIVQSWTQSGGGIGVLRIS